MSIPGKHALLEASIRYIEAELFPSLVGEHAFKTRVALNALKIVQREMASRALDHSVSGTIPDKEAQTVQVLCEEIRKGGVDLHDVALVQGLRQGLKSALEINNPKWLLR